MKNCPVCNAPVDDTQEYCPNCGTKVNYTDNYTRQNPQQNPNPQGGAYGNFYQQPVAPVDPYDHTAEFDQKDVSDNKVFALAIYLTGVIGLVIALFACKDSEFIRFHIRQYMKMLVADAFVSIVAVLFCWTFIVPVAAGVCAVILLVLQIIAFFQVAGGKSKEPSILRDLKCFR